MNLKLPPDMDKVRLDELAARLGIRTATGRIFLERALENVLLFDGKQQDYGPRNISDFGTYGVIVRMNDKFRRVANLFRKGRRRRAVNESIRDSFRDISNYAIIAFMLEENQWPEVDSEFKHEKPL